MYFVVLKKLAKQFLPIFSIHFWQTTDMLHFWRSWGEIFFKSLTLLYTENVTSNSILKNSTPFTGMSASISLNAIRNVFADEPPSHYPTSPVYTMPPKEPVPTPLGARNAATTTTFGTMPHRPNAGPAAMSSAQASRLNDESFDRATAKRNSLTKRYLSHLGSNTNGNVEVGFSKMTSGRA